jgi:hypothetical protein
MSQARNQREADSKQTAYSSTLKMEATGSSEMSADFQQTTWRYISEDRTVIGCVLFVIYWPRPVYYATNPRRPTCMSL